MPRWRGMSEQVTPVEARQNRINSVKRLNSRAGE
jgi:hypothetical protein